MLAAGEIIERGLVVADLPGDGINREQVAQRPASRCRTAGVDGIEGQPARVRRLHVTRVDVRDRDVICDRDHGDVWCAGVALGVGCRIGDGYRWKIVSAGDRNRDGLRNRCIVAVVAIVFDGDRIGRRYGLAFREVLDQIGIQREIPVEVVIACSQGRRRNRQCGCERQGQCRRYPGTPRRIVVVGDVRCMRIRQIGVGERDRAVVFQNTTDRVDVFLDRCAVVDDGNNGLVVRRADLNGDLLC